MNLWSLKLYVATQCWLQCCTYKNLWSDLELVKYLMLNFSESLPNLHELNSTSYCWLTMAKTQKKILLQLCLRKFWAFHFIFVCFLSPNWSLPLANSDLPHSRWVLFLSTLLFQFTWAKGDTNNDTTTFLLRITFMKLHMDTQKITRFDHPRKLTWQMENHHV